MDIPSSAGAGVGSFDFAFVFGLALPFANMPKISGFFFSAVDFDAPEDAAGCGVDRPEPASSDALPFLDGAGLVSGVGLAVADFDSVFAAGFAAAGGWYFVVRLW